MSDTEELLTGRAGNEAAQGFTPMPMANPDPPAEPAIDSDSAIAKHLQRPAMPEPTERAYTDQGSGVPRPDNEVVEMDRAARDLSDIRAAENLELEKQRNADLNEALDWLQREQSALQDATTPRPVEQQQQPLEPQPTPEQFQAMSPEEQNALFEANQARIQEADRQLQAALADPIVRERIEGEFNQVRAQAAAQVEQAKTAFQNATAGLATEAAGIIGALYPELAGLSVPQMQGAIAVMAKNQPERVAQLQQLMGRTQNIVAAHQQQVAQEQARLQQQHAAALQQYTDQQVKVYEAAIARDRTPEQARALRENVMPMVQKHYGVSEQEFRALYSGQARVDAATFMRSANFQLMLSDALSYRMSREALPRAASRTVPNVVRPGSTADSISRKDAALAAAEAKLRPEMSPKQAAEYLIARRGASR